MNNPVPMTIKHVLKRDGQTVPFDRKRIVNAISKGMHATKEGSYEEAEKVGENVCIELEKIKKQHKSFEPNVEGIQDMVEKSLILAGYVQTAKAYILYREKHAQIRAKAIQIPEHVRKLADESQKYFRSTLSEFVYLRTYARWIEAEGRRETWIETCLLYTSPSPRDGLLSRMPSSA